MALQKLLGVIFEPVGGISDKRQPCTMIRQSNTTLKLGTSEFLFGILKLQNFGFLT